MSIAVSCNLSDGVILGVDSAVTVPAPGGVSTVYENADKLFQFGNRPIGIATFGLGSMEARSIGSYLRQFQLENSNIVDAENTISDIVEALRSFFMSKYTDLVIPAIERAAQQQKKELKDIPLEQWPDLGLVVGGFSANAYLSEVWEIRIPRDGKLNTSKQRRKQGQFGSSWFARYDPIQRYRLGFDERLVNELLKYCENLRGSPFSDSEQVQIRSILRKHEYPVAFGAMPIMEGVKYVRFLVELVVNHYRFLSGPPIVGGQVRMGMVTYGEKAFRILDN